MEKNLYSIRMQCIVKESSQWNEEAEKNLQMLHLE